MRRIITDQASTGRPIAIRNEQLKTGENTLVEAPDFSIPVREEQGLIIEDTSGRERQIVPGEILIISPLFVTNQNLSTTYWVQIIIRPEFGLDIPWSSQINIPANETISIPLQGTSLLKTNLDSSGVQITGGSLNGDRLIIVTQTGSVLSCYCTATESEMGTHAPDSEATLGV